MVEAPGAEDDLSMRQPMTTERGPDRASALPAKPLQSIGRDVGTSASTAAAAVRPAPDPVETYGDDSFPASDPPGWWAGP